MDIRRAALGEIHTAKVRVKRHLRSANTPGLGDVLGRGAEAPSGGTSLSFMAAKSYGPGSRSVEVAVEPIGRSRLNRAPRLKYKHLVGPGTKGIYRALEYFRRLTKGADDVPVGAVASEQGYTCVAARILLTPFAPNVNAATPPCVLPEGMATALGITRTLSRIAKEAACVVSSFFRAPDACDGYQSKYNLPMSKGGSIPAPPTIPPIPCSGQPPSPALAYPPARPDRLKPSRPPSPQRAAFPVKKSGRRGRAKKQSWARQRPSVVPAC